MTPKEQIALQVTSALIQADPSILKSADPLLLDRRIKAALDLYGRVNEMVANRSKAEA